MAEYSGGFPRTLLPIRCTIPKMPGALYSWGQSGKPQARSTAQVGRIWTETWNNIDPNSAAGAELIHAIQLCWGKGDYFSIVPACYRNKAKLGGGTGTPLINGASQTGASIITDGWSGSNPILTKGEMVVFVGYPLIRQVTADVTHASGAATIPIWPPILTALPDNTPLGFGIDVTLNGTASSGWYAMIAAEPSIPDVDGGTGFLPGIAVSFREYFTV